MMIDAPIVLLDETTDSLNPENELLIPKAIGEMVKSKNSSPRVLNLLIFISRISADQQKYLKKCYPNFNQT